MALGSPLRRPSPLEVTMGTSMGNGSRQQPQTNSEIWTWRFFESHMKRPQQRQLQWQEQNTLAPGFWILESGFWVLASGFWILDSGLGTPAQVLLVSSSAGRASRGGDNNTCATTTEVHRQAESHLPWFHCSILQNIVRIEINVSKRWWQ